MSQANGIEREMLALINDERVSRGLDPLKLELNLNQAAEGHSEWMLSADVFSHTGSNGSSAGQRMDAAGFDFSGSWRWGENVAYQSERGASGLSDDVADLHRSLMNSPGHRSNILKAEFDYIGIGIEYGDYKGYDVVMVTQNFAATGGSVDLDSGGASTPTPPPPPPSDPVPPAPSTIYGTSASERIYGTSGEDLVRGLDGDDKLWGRRSDDELRGDGGNDKIWGGDGDDELRGDGGNDKLNGGAGSDDLIGGFGEDRADYKDASRGVRADLQNSSVNTGDAAGDTYVSIERIYGSRHDDRLGGDGAANKLWGGAGSDRLEGRGGDDILKGGDGRDTIDGGSGNDDLFGGTGADLFVFGIGDGRDRVRDFENNQDTLDLRSFDLSMSELAARANQNGSDVVLDLGSTRIVIEDVSLSNMENDLLI